MKKVCILGFSIILLLSTFMGFTLPQDIQGQTGTDLVFDYSFEIPTPQSGISAAFQEIVIPNTTQYCETGKPTIPMRTTNILVPYGKEIENVEVLTTDKVYLGKYYIQPGEKPIPIDDGDTDSINSETPLDTAIYESMNPYPEKPYANLGVQWKMGYQILIVNLYPLQYIPKSRDVSYFKNLKLKIKTMDTEISRRSLYRGLPQDKELILNIVDNPEQVATYDHHISRETMNPPLDDIYLSYGFDYPIGVPQIEGGSGYVTADNDGDGYYNAQDFGDFNEDHNGYHLGEDWNGEGWGDTDFGDPVYTVSNGQVTYAQNAGTGWGNVIIIHHILPDGTSLCSMYAHLRYDSLLVDEGDTVQRGQKIAEIGKGYQDNEYSAHLHFELRDNIEIILGPGYSTNPEPLGWLDPSEFIDAHRPLFGKSFDYMIITNQQFKNATGPNNFQTLASWKESRGIKTQIVTLEEIYSNYSGLDGQDRIRNFIRDTYINNGTRYVLLGGDADGSNVGGESGNNIVPVRQLWAWAPEYEPVGIASDLYYACLDGNYDSNGNGKYGEPDDGPDGGEVDLMAEVYVGRAPVDSATELANFVNKTISYESTSDATYLIKTWMVGEKLSGNSDCAVETAMYESKIDNAKYKLDILRALRDKDIKKEYVQQYYEFSPYIKDILLHDPRLSLDLAGLVVKYLPAIQNILDTNNNSELKVTDECISDMSSFVARLKEQVETNKQQIGEQNSLEIIRLLDEFTEQTRQAKGQSFSSAFQNSIYYGSGTPMAGETWGGDYKDEIKNGSSNNGYSTQGIPDTYNKNTLYDRDYSGNNWPKSALINIINSGVHFINHMGHANENYVMKMYNSDIDGLTNTKYFFGYSQGCYAGAFDNRNVPSSSGSVSYLTTDCAAEHFVVNSTGAFAFIANSRYGWYTKNSTNGPSQNFDRQFWDAIFGENITNLGMANQDSKEDNISLISSGVIRFCYYELNLLGDPETKLHVVTPAHDIAVSDINAPETLGATGSVSIRAIIKNQGLQNESQITVTLLDNNIPKATTKITNLQPETTAEVSFSWSSNISRYPHSPGICSSSIWRAKYAQQLSGMYYHRSGNCYR